ncbi:MAG TPA: glycoside hydrolase family 127 protein [Armatimonadetes bacterium]|nr:glycoside hydrolase family 127 protein [Armatimonadota bacterium]
MNHSSAVVVNTGPSPQAKLHPVPLNAVRLADKFWAPRLKLLREVTLPTQHQLLRETGRLDNFRRAAGKVKGDFQGLYFNDSDVYKWLEAVACALAYQPDSRLASLAEVAVAEIAAAQDEDGYLDTYFTFERRGERWTNLRDMHELYCAGHLFQAAIAHHRATGEESLLQVAVRLADHIAEVFGPHRRPGTPGHPEIEMALVELYRETGQRRYLELAQFFLDQRGRGLLGGGRHHIDHQPFRELTEMVGHAVRSAYLNAGATDILLETGEAALREALERLWQNMTERRMYVTGGIGARYEGEAFGEDYELPNERAYAETCAAVANGMWNWRMLLLTGEERFAEVLELALYNGALAGISLDGQAYFYVNPLADRGQHRRQPWFHCACCPPNIARFLASLPGRFYATSPEGIWVHLYAESTAQVDFGGQTVELNQRTDYPWEGEVEIALRPASPQSFSLFLRIPGWCPEATVEVNGEPVGKKAVPGAYLEVQREWRAGDGVRLSLAMRPEWLEAHPWVGSNAGRLALRRGPLIYCLEQVDHPDFDVWDLAVVPQAPLQAEWKPELLKGLVVLRGEGVLVDGAAWGGHLYRPLRLGSQRAQAVPFTAIPYFAWANREAGPMQVWPLLGSR